MCIIYLIKQRRILYILKPAAECIYVRMFRWKVQQQQKHDTHTTKANHLLIWQLGG